MISPFASNAFVLLLRAKRLALLPVFLTLCLTNCGQNGGSNTENQEFSIWDFEAFKADDLSNIPLDEKDLETLASQSDRHYLVEKRPSFNHTPDKPYSSKLVT